MFNLPRSQFASSNMNDVNTKTKQYVKDRGIKTHRSLARLLRYAKPVRALFIIISWLFSEFRRVIFFSVKATVSRIALPVERAPVYLRISWHIFQWYCSHHGEAFFSAFTSVHVSSVHSALFVGSTHDCNTPSAVSIPQTHENANTQTLALSPAFHLNGHSIIFLVILRVCHCVRYHVNIIYGINFCYVHHSICLRVCTC